MEHKRSGAGGSGSDSELNKRTPEGSRLSGGFLCCTNFTRPTGNLDSKNSQEVITLLKSMSAKYRQTILMITHNENHADATDRVLRMTDGRLRDLGVAAR